MLKTWSILIFLPFGKRKSESQKDNCEIDNRKKHDIYVIGLQECKADDLQSYIASMERGAVHRTQAR